MRNTSALFLLAASLALAACSAEKAAEQPPPEAAPPADVAADRPAGGGGQGGPPPRRVLRLIYDQYSEEGATPRVLVDDRLTLERFFDDEMVSLLLADFACQKTSGDACKLDWDPFVAGQDWKIEDLAMSRVSAGPDQAVLEARFKNLGKDTVVHYSLVKLPRGWRITDISYPPGGPDKPSLKTVLSKT
jgi:hypothetical protein